MGDWLDEVHNWRFLERTEEVLEIEKCAKAKQHAIQLLNILLEDIRTTVIAHREKTGEHARVSGPTNTGVSSQYVVGTNQYPHCKVIFSCVEDRIEYTKVRQATADAEPQLEHGSFLVKAELNDAYWVEREGLRLSPIPDSMTQSLLIEVIQNS